MLQDRIAPLAEADAKAWDDALGRPRCGGDRHRGGRRRTARPRLERRLERAAAIPLEIAEIGADVAELAAVAWELRRPRLPRGRGRRPPRSRPAARRAAAHLVEVNLAVRAGDDQLARARASEQAAAEAADRLLASIR